MDILNGYVLICTDRRLLCVDTKGKKEKVVASYDHDVQSPVVRVYYDSSLSTCVVYIQLFGQVSENTV